MVREYLLGEREKMTDLMAWNADGTRLPYRMHSEYLRQLFLNNDLAEGRYHAGGRPVALADIAQPIFVVSTVKDHVAPWRSVYKIHLLSDTDLTFVLTTGGHNAGIVTEPGHPRRSFQMAEHRPGDRHPDPDTWLTLTPRTKGSWWPAWQAWLTKHSTGLVPPPSIGAPGADIHSWPTPRGVTFINRRSPCRGAAPSIKVLRPLNQRAIGSQEFGYANTHTNNGGQALPGFDGR